MNRARLKNPAYRGPKGKTLLYPPPLQSLSQFFVDDTLFVIVNHT